MTIEVRCERSDGSRREHLPVPAFHDGSTDDAYEGDPDARWNTD